MAKQTPQLKWNKEEAMEKEKRKEEKGKDVGSIAACYIYARARVGGFATGVHSQMTHRKK
jgi:hypothetical protein